MRLPAPATWAILSAGLALSITLASNAAGKPSDLIAHGGSAGRRLSTARPTKFDNRWNVYLRSDQVVVESELTSSGEVIRQNFLFSQSGAPSGYLLQSQAKGAKKQSVECVYGAEMRCTASGESGPLTFKVATPGPAVFFVPGAEVDYLWTMLAIASFIPENEKCRTVATYDLPGDDSADALVRGDDVINICRAGATSAYTPKGRVPATEYVFNGAMEGKLWIGNNGLPIHLEMQDVAFESEGQLAGGRKKLFLEREGSAAQAAAH